MDDPTLISLAEGRALSGSISASTQRRLIDWGEYPKPIVLSRIGSGRPARVALVRAEVMDWCRRRIAAGRRDPETV